LIISDICYLRLDFETFTTVGPTLSTEAASYVCPDTFKVTVSFKGTVPFARIEGAVGAA
jgi:hypothetical protein